MEVWTLIFPKSLIIQEYYSVLQSVTGCYRVLLSVTEYCRVLQSIAGYCRVLQSIAFPLHFLILSPFSRSQAATTCVTLLPDLKFV